MNQIMPPPRMEIIPSNAPFSDQQRQWLNGFLVGMLGLDGTTLLSPEQNDAVLAPGGDGDDGEASWHDQTLPIAERMKLAEGRPLRRRMMAAMAQQDCGQCGYNCQDYSDALFSRKEARLNLCVPGGKETARMLKTLNQELERSPSTPATKIPAATAADATAAPAATRGRSRDNPTEATFLARTCLNKPGSGKETWHIEFDLAGSGIDYAVGDVFGVLPSNDPALADAVIAALAGPADFPIGGRTLREVLIDGVSLGTAPDMLFELFSY